MRHLTRQRHTSPLALLLVLAIGAAEPGDALAFTRGKIAGKVVDAATNQPLVGVNVLIVGTTMGAATDAQGEYYIANVPPGTYDLRASIIGFRDVTVTGVRVHIDQTSEVDFEMQETVLELSEPIVVTATRPLIEKDNTSTRRVVEARELQLRPMTEFTQVLTSLPGINEENGVMRVRGGTLDQVAFVVDGARARNPLDHSPYTSFNLSSIQEVEVITGSFNAEYGEAQSGVVNIITKEGGDKYHLFIDQRYMPPAKRHWGSALYDRSTDLYWENSHARHLQWWIDHPDQWVDANGAFGNDPNSIWSPEQAYEHYLQTHQPLTDYAKMHGFQTEVSFGGPLPFVNDFSFFMSGKYRVQAPLFGNSYRDRGTFFNGTLKLIYAFDPAMKLHFSGFLGTEKTSWGIFEQPDFFYATTFGYRARYAYYDLPGLPESQTDGQTLKFSHVLDQSSLYEIKLSRVQAFRKLDAFPDDPLGWRNASGVTMTDNIRARDENGNPIDYEQGNPLGYNTTGYLYRINDKNTDWTLTGFYSSQFNKHWQLKTGAEFTYYNLDHYNEAKFPPAVDNRTYNPYQGALYLQNKLEFGGFIMNLGLRYDFYNPNDSTYVNLFDPLDSPKEATKTFSQLSPRLGIAHPIDDRTVLHFSYGHFFQRGNFADYGDGLSDESVQGSLTTFIDSTGTPFVLGNRNVKPRKTVAFEVGVERNFADVFILDVTAYYKDITNTNRVVRVIDPQTGLSYQTNGNGDYADVRGLEISLRKLYSHYVSGYVNFSTQLGIQGRSGDANRIFPDRQEYGASGDFILHSNPRLKVGIFFQTPPDGGMLGGVLDDVVASLEYQIVYPNRDLRQDVFRYNDSTYNAALVRPGDKNANFKMSKGFSLFDNALRVVAFVEVRNLFNEKWVNFAAVERASLEDQKTFAQSDFKVLPTKDVNGVPMLDIAKFRNLPRSVLFGISMDF